MSVSGLREPIKLTFKTGPPNEGKTFIAYYYDEYLQKWSSDGVTWSMQFDQLKVLVTHLTSFTPAEEDTSSQGPRKEHLYETHVLPAIEMINELNRDGARNSPTERLMFPK